MFTCLYVDFLLPKLFLFCVGAYSVIILAYFDFFEKESVGINSWTQYQKSYATFSLIQISVLAIWIILICRASVITAAALRKEAFLSTRPAQLVFRIMMSMIFLSFAAAIILFGTDIYSFESDWDYDDHGSEEYGNSTGSHSHVSIDTFFRIAIYIKEKIPYTGNAASLGPGQILFLTVSIITLSFIFLPSTDFILNLDQYTTESIDDAIIQREFQRRDKRSFLRLGRNAHTWRVFPSPIDKEETFVKKLQYYFVEHYEVDKNFQLVSNQWGAGTIYRNKYTPVFCIETALWLLECSWQTCMSQCYITQVTYLFNLTIFIPRFNRLFSYRIQDR